MKKYAVINTMSAIENAIVGTIVSTHNSYKAASAADEKLQRQVKASNGQNSCLPTVIMELLVKAGNGAMVEPSEVASIDLD